MKMLFISKYGFQNLLVILILYLTAGPLLNQFPLAHVFVDFLLTVGLVLAVYVIHKRITLPFLMIPMLVVVLGFLWIEKTGYFPYSEKLNNLMLGLYLFFLVYSFLRYIFSVKKVDSNLICATLCLYLILGLLWGSIYAALQQFIPGSFAGDLLNAASEEADNLQFFTYFSFTTLTTLGYGDILPQSQVATALCQVEAILGQFFTAVLVARLVGIQVAQQFMDDT
jgi:voltage-gated potassium channel